MRRLVALSFAMTLLGCRDLTKENRPYKVYPQDANFYQTSVNPVEKASAPIVLKNDSFPLEVTLFNDGHFTYYMANFKDHKSGVGTWEYEGDEGFVKLYAERPIFVMHMAMRALDPVNTDALTIEFSDRFGPKYLPLTVVK